MKKPIIQFPCFFPLKIIGNNSTGFETEITKIIYNHCSEASPPQVSCKQSSSRNYISITATVYVQNQQALDLLYQDLCLHPEIKMVL